MATENTKVNLTGIVLAGGRSSRFGFNKLKIKVDTVPLFIDQIFKLSFFCDEIIVSTSKSNYPTLFSELNKIRTYQKKYNFEKIQASNLKIDFNEFAKKNSAFQNIRIISDESDVDNLNTSNSLNITNSEKITPSHKGKGPVIGIYTSLANASYFYSIIVAFDMPFISYNLLKSLVYESGINTEEPSSSEPATISYDYSKKRDAYIIKTEKGFEVLCGLYSKNCLGILKENIGKQKYKISDIFNYLDIEIISINKLKQNGIDSLNFFNINRLEDYHRFKNLWQNKNISSNTATSFIEIWSYFFFR
ncbi:MAG: molybdenum cofactor guanylyltransferase [Actinobacteria bacterium]|nr:MAG: molybdenum cofactor guanylyltransferase [Actinomycetota bacterium]